MGYTETLGLEQYDKNKDEKLSYEEVSEIINSGDVINFKNTLNNLEADTPEEQKELIEAYGEIAKDFKEAILELGENGELDRGDVGLTYLLQIIGKVEGTYKQEDFDGSWCKKTENILIDLKEQDKRFINIKVRGDGKMGKEGETCKVEKVCKKEENSENNTEIKTQNKEVKETNEELIQQLELKENLDKLGLQIEPLLKEYLDFKENSQLKGKSAYYEIELHTKRGVLNDLFSRYFIGYDIYFLGLTHSNDRFKEVLTIGDNEELESLNFYKYLVFDESIKLRGDIEDKIGIYNGLEHFKEIGFEKSFEMGGENTSENYRILKDTLNLKRKINLITINNEFNISGDKELFSKYKQELYKYVYNRDLREESFGIKGVNNNEHLTNEIEEQDYKVGLIGLLDITIKDINESPSKTGKEVNLKLFHEIINSMLSDSLRYRVTKGGSKLNLYYAGALANDDRIPFWNKEYAEKSLQFGFLDSINYIATTTADGWAYITKGLQEVTNDMYDSEKEYDFSKKDLAEISEILDNAIFKGGIDGGSDFMLSLVDLGITPHVALPNITENLMQLGDLGGMEEIESILGEYFEGRPDRKAYYTSYISTILALIVKTPVVGVISYTGRGLTILRAKLGEELFVKIFDGLKNTKLGRTFKITDLEGKTIKGSTLSGNNGYLKFNKGYKGSNKTQTSKPQKEEVNIKENDKNKPVNPNAIEGKTFGKEDDINSLLTKGIEKVTGLQKKFILLRNISKEVEQSGIKTTLSDTKIFEGYNLGKGIKDSVEKGLKNKVGFTDDELKYINKYEVKEGSNYITDRAILSMRKASEVVSNEAKEIKNLYIKGFVKGLTMEQSLVKYDTKTIGKINSLFEEGKI